jgi:hypothetical protein
MKNFILLFTVALFVGCASSGVQVTFDDENSNTIRQHLQHYLDGDMDSLMALAADNAEIYINSEESISPDEIRPLLEAQHSTFDPITISWSQEKGGEDIGVWVESTNYPAGPANEAANVTQAWFTWHGTSKLTGETISVPAHIVYVWNTEEKIETEYQFFDSVNINAAIEAYMAASE